tara:strand:- start:9776 stop:10390 length:615 start_codon:yes stop_codon:yes gene_type:complete
MKTIKFFTLLTLFITFISCDKEDDTPSLVAVESKAITNLKAEQTSDYTTNPPTISGDYIKFSFETGAATTTDNWDIAFRGSTILVNGGEATAEDQPERTGNAAVYITSGTLASVEEVTTALLKTDSSVDGLAITTGSGNGWYNYDQSTHIITPIAGKVLVVKTNNGKYAKLEILSYYKDADTSSDSQYYTFNYIYQPNEGVTTF